MAAPPQPLTIDIVNNSTNLLHVYVVGTKLGNGSQPQFIMKPDGKTSSDLLPGMPSGRLPPGTGDGTVLYKQGDKFSFNINFFFSGRVYIAYSNSLPWSINAGSQPALVHPSPTTPGYDAANPDSAIGGLTQWSFCELTYDQSGLTTNISYVDSVCVPIALTAEDENGAHQHVSGMDDRGLQQFADQLQAVQSQDTAGNWANLVQWSGKGGDRKPVRILAPHQLMLIRNDQFKGYWEPYVDQVWAHIAAQGITVNTQSDAGDIKGHIEGDPTSVGSMLVFDDGSRFTKPRSIDCFASGSVDGQGPWVEGGSPFSAGDPKTSQRAKIIPRLCAAFARTLFMFSQDQPGSLKPDQYYQAYPTNLYAEICHHLNLDHKGYAFAYDDVHADNAPDVSGLIRVVKPNVPKSLQVEVGGIGANTNDDGPLTDYNTAAPRK